MKPIPTIRNLALVLAFLWLGQGVARAEDEVAAQAGLTVEARGPIHEAFAQPYEAAAKPAPVVPKQPPQPIPEIPPDQKPADATAIWIPGYWAWDPDRSDFLWVSGVWRVPPTGRRWVPGYWTEADGGWQWVSGFWTSDETEQLTYVEEPPPASVDYGPDSPAPDDNSFYIPGSWVYRRTGYAWRPGYWSAYRPGAIWCPANYYWTPTGYAFVDGYWDYPLEDRGLLFAPVYFDQPLWTTPGWYYRPSYAVRLGSLLASLFMRPWWGHYYYGDYYGAAYTNWGFQPWYSYGPRSYDPLFSYYRWNHSGDPGWYRGLANTYRGRFNGDLARPPRTLIAQNRLLQQTTVSGNRTRINLGDPNTLQMVAPLNQLRDPGVRLASLTSSQIAAQRAQAQGLRDLSRSRWQAERAQTAAAGAGGTRGLSPARLRLPAQQGLARKPAARSPRGVQDGAATTRVPGSATANRPVPKPATRTQPATPSVTRQQSQGGSPQRSGFGPVQPPNQRAYNGPLTPYDQQHGKYRAAVPGGRPAGPQLQHQAAPARPTPPARQHQAAPAQPTPPRPQHQAAPAHATPPARQHQAAATHSTPPRPQHQAAPAHATPPAQQHRAASTPPAPSRPQHQAAPAHASPPARVQAPAHVSHAAPPVQHAPPRPQPSPHVQTHAAPAPQRAPSAPHVQPHVSAPRAAPAPSHAAPAHQSAPAHASPQHNK